MNNRGIFLALFILFSFLSSIYADGLAYIDDITGTISDIKSMSGVYTKEIINNNNKVKTKVTFFEDNENAMKHFIVQDNLGQKGDIFMVKDTMFILDKLNKKIYYISMNDFGDLEKNIFNISLFDGIKILKTIKESSKPKESYDKKKVLYVQFVSDTSNKIYSNVIVRFNKENQVDLIEMYDYNGNVMIQTNLKAYKDKLPRNMKTLTKSEGMVIEEKISISKLELNKKIDKKEFAFSRKGFTLLSLKEGMEGLVQ